LLAEEHGVSWSVETVRKVVADLSNHLAPLTHAAQVEYLLEWVRSARTENCREKRPPTINFAG